MEKNGDRTVMVVEDFHDARATLKDAPETKGFRVVEAADGWEAVGLAATRVRPVKRSDRVRVVIPAGTRASATAVP